MFTGLVEVVGIACEVADTPSGRRLVVEPANWDHVPAPGASIAVSGCCLTVVGVKQGRFLFDVVHRTLELTTLGVLQAGDRVNLEKSATLETLLGGHLVQGHVDGVGVVRAVDDGDDWRVRIEAPSAVADHLVDRGSIAVDGVSLTVARVLRDLTGRVDGFEVALIPETLARTTLADVRPGHRVNLEADAMSKMIASHLERMLASRSSEIDRAPAGG
jgi:riboflavin synthase